MPEPLLFVCQSIPVRPGSRLARASLLPFKSPGGGVFVAFGAHNLAAAILALFGAAEGVFLLPETRLLPELVPAEPISPVFVVNTIQEYRAATGDVPDFPWSEHVIAYDFAAAAACASVLRDDFGGPSKESA